MLNYVNFILMFMNYKPSIYVLTHSKQGIGISYKY